MVKRKFFAGDTLVEVMIAVGIFCLVAIGVVSVMSSSTAKVQSTLELTMTRNEIDAQAEALRFIQSAYIAERDVPADQRIYSKVWETIKGLAVNAAAEGNLAAFNPSTCNELYTESGQAKSHGFILNYKRLSAGTNPKAINPNNVVLSRTNQGATLQMAQLYPRLVFGEDKLYNEDSTNALSYAEGIYIIALFDPESTNIAAPTATDINDNSKSTQKASAYFDFYIRSCWQAPGSDHPNLDSTVIRLYDPDVDVVKYALTNYSLSYDLQGGTPTIQADTASVYEPSYGFKITPTEPTKPGKTFLGWAASDWVDGSNCSPLYTNTGAKYSKDYYVASASNPIVTLRAIYECPYYLKYTTAYGTFSGNTKERTLIYGPASEKTHIFDINKNSQIPTVSYSDYKEFKGWKTAVNNGGTQVCSGGAEVCNGKTLTAPHETSIEVSAIWNNIFKVNFCADDENCVNSGNYVRTNTEVSDLELISNYNIYSNGQVSAVKSGYDFLGWSTTRGGPVIKDNGKIEIHVGENYLFPVFKLITYDYVINYLDENNNAVCTAKETKTTTSMPYTINCNLAPAKSGYRFVGWKYNGTTYNNGNSITINKGTTSIVAVYALITYDYAVNYEGASSCNWSSVGSETRTSLEYVVNCADYPDKSGYDFKGWNYGGSILQNGSKITITPGTTTIRPEYVKKTYTYFVKYCLDPECTSSKTWQKSTTDTSISYTPQNYVTSVKTLANRVYVGWSTNQNATTENRSLSGSYTLNTTHLSETLYPAYSYAYTVRYCTNENCTTYNDTPYTKSESSMQYTSASSAPYSLTNMKFVGWSVATGGTTQDWNSGAAGTIQYGLTIFQARWEVAQLYTFYFYDNGGSGGPGTITQGSPTIDLRSVRSPYRTNYSFSGWGTSSVGPVIWTYTMQPGQTSVSFSANWSKSPRELTYSFTVCVHTDNYKNTNFVFDISGTVSGSYSGSSSVSGHVNGGNCMSGGSITDPYGASISVSATPRNAPSDLQYHYKLFCSWNGGSNDTTSSSLYCSW